MNVIAWILSLFGSKSTAPVPTPAPAPAPVVPVSSKPVIPQPQPETKIVTPTPAPAPTPAPVSTPTPTSKTYVVTGEILERIMPKGAKTVDMVLFAAAFNRVFALQQVNITTADQAAMFIAQSAHESTELTKLREVWGPTATQKAYEGSKILGNTQPGDGFKFRGGGVQQLTGRWNWTAFSKWAGIDFVNNTDMIIVPYNAVLSAGWFWSYRKLAAAANAHDVVRETLLINGGSNGLASREAYYNTACDVLGVTI